MKRLTSILGMNGTIMTKKEITADEGTSAFQALERSLLGV
jgi:hypothetical protein